MNPAELESLLKKGVDNLFAENSKDRFLPNIYRISHIVQCPAKEYLYRKTGIRPKQNSAMFNGSLLHLQIPEIIKKIPDFEKAQYEVECIKDHNEFKLVGHADAVTEDTVYEFKYSGSNIERYGGLSTLDAASELLRNNPWQEELEDCSSEQQHAGS